jgi:Fe-S-cluster containining protein
VSSESPLFPPDYAPWLASRLGGTLKETLATCDQCAMVKPSGLTRDAGPFAADLKCCTYFPFVPNFSLGSMLNEDSAAIRLRIETASQQGLLLPVGLYATPERQTAMEKRSRDFGRKRELICPFFDTQSLGCSVWKQRPGVCTTYFCKSDKAESGLEFWSDLEDYLNHFEWTLAVEIFSRMGLGEIEMEMCESIMATEANDPERAILMRGSWGPWWNRKDEFYKLSLGKALAISPSELNEILGEESLELEQTLRQNLLQLGGVLS